MSFGEDKRRRIEELEEQLKKARSTLGGSQHACNVLKGEKRTLQEEVERLKGLNGELCAEINAKDRRLRGIYSDLKGVAPDLARVWARAFPELEGRWTHGAS